jgi:long-subunit acyl-CoA synthetase (AMP-forming)
VENGLLTPTLKLKRSAIEERYRPSLAGWYATGERIIWG